jgi:eukaryotic-like serine/threonine-protein kinase
MSDLLTCQEGHQWVSALDDGAPSATCPVCGGEAANPAASTPDSAYRNEITQDTPTLAAERPKPGLPPPVLSPVKAGIPGYELLGELGRGGMGVVYKAKQRGLNRLVAIKMILAASHASGKDRTRFRQEAEVVAQLHHPNVVQIYEVGEAEGRPYFSLEFISGGNLADQLNGTPWPARQAVQLIAKLAGAIHAAHKLGIVHRDLKPANVLLEEVPGEASGSLGNPKITDFGLAKRLDAESDGPTQSGTILGTPSYMAPEQAGGGKHGAVGPTSDVYALGAILYELLTGRPPFRAETPMETVLQVMNQEPVPPRRLQPKLPRDLETICLKCLQKESARRYASGEELAADLERFLGGVPIRARSVGLIERGVKWVRRRPLAPAVLAPAVLLLGGVALAWLSHDPVLALIILIVPVFLIGLGGIAWQWERAQVQKNRAEEQRHQAEAARQEAEQERLKADAARREAEEQTRKTAAALAAAEGNLYYFQIALAERELHTAHVTRAEELLDGCPPPLRHWEWHYLKRICHGELVTLPGHTRPVLTLAYSPDCQGLISAGWDPALFVWDAAKGELVRKLAGHSAQVTSVTFSLDGRWLASAGGDQNIILWDAETGTQLQVFQGHSTILGLAFHPKGRFLASAGSDQLIRIWDAVTGKPTLQLRGHTREVTSVAYSPDGLYIASAGRDGLIRLWDAGTGNELLTLKGHTGPVLAVTFSPTRPVVLSAGEDRTIRAWDAITGREVAVFRGHDGTVMGVAFAPDGNKFASVSWDRTARLWDAATGQALATLRGHTGIVTGVAFRPDGQHVATAGEDRTVKIWDTDGTSESRCLRGHSNGVLSVALSPDGNLLLSGSGRLQGNAPGEVKLWDLNAFQEMPLRAEAAGSVTAVAFSPDGQHGAAADEHGTLWLWNPVVGKAKWTLRGHSRALVGLAYLPDAAGIVSASEDGLAKIWRTEDGRELLAIRANMGPLVCLAVSSDGRRIALASRDPVKNRSEVRLFDAVSGKEVLSLGRFATPVVSMAFRPDGQLLASASRDGIVKFWDAVTGKAGRVLRGHTGEVASLAFSPDGKRLASASHDRTLKLWETATGQEILTLKGHTAEVAAVAFSGDGLRLVSASMDQTVRLWDATPIDRAAGPDETPSVPPTPVNGDSDQTRFDPKRVTGREGQAANPPIPR